MQGVTAVSSKAEAANGYETVGRTYLLTVGFGTTVATWAVGYLGRLSPGVVPSWGLLALMLLVQIAGGWVAGRYTGAGWPAGARTGLLSSFLNLLILGSLLGGASPNQVVPSALWWIPGSLVVGALMGALGGGLAGRRPEVAEAQPNWTNGFAVVAAVATFFLLIVGGIVTGAEAGLAVVDWPNSYGYNMFLYPLSKMSGGIYYEHAHRLFGSLVGLTTLVLAVHLVVVERRRWLRLFALMTVVTVIAQGLLGGLRVTGRLTFSDSPADVTPKIVLAIVHGVVGQIFLGMMVSIAVFTSTIWRRRQAGLVRSSARTDRILATSLVVSVVLQIAFGAVLRHLSMGLMIHIGMAMVVLILAISVGVRVWSIKPPVPVLVRLGPWLMVAVSVQLGLGFVALVVSGLEASEAGARPFLDVALTTVHQATGAAILALSVVVMLWTYRLLAPRKAARAEGSA